MKNLLIHAIVNHYGIGFLVAGGLKDLVEVTRLENVCRRERQRAKKVGLLAIDFPVGVLRVVYESAYDRRGLYDLAGHLVAQGPPKTCSPQSAEQAYLRGGQKLPAESWPPRPTIELVEKEYITSRVLIGHDFDIRISDQRATQGPKK